MTKTQARVLLPNRGQMELRANDLESLLPEGHRVRLVWAYVERQDLRQYCSVSYICAMLRPLLSWSETWHEPKRYWGQGPG